MINIYQLTEQWSKEAKNLSYSYIMIMKDLEEGDYYPIFSHSYDEIQKLRKSIISEHKTEVIKVICFK